MRIFRFKCIWLDRDLAGIAVDEDDHILRGFALDLQCVKAGELEERSEISTDVAVDHILCEWTERHDRGFSAAGIGRDPANRTIGNDQLILRIVPFRLGCDRIPEQLKAKAAPAGEQVLHLLGDRLFADRIVSRLT